MKYAAVLIMGENKSEQLELQKWVADAGDFDIRLLNDNDADAIVNHPDTLDEDSGAVVIYNCDSLGEMQLVFLKKISQALGHRKFLVLARQFSVHAYREVGAIDNMIALQRPFQMDVFKTILSTILSRSEPPSRRFPRFITDEPVRMVVMKSGLLIPTRMKNYSVGGAFLEYRGISLKVGDTLRLGLDPKEQIHPSKTFQLMAKVIWIKNGEHPRSANRGIGIQFLA